VASVKSIKTTAVTVGFEEAISGGDIALLTHRGHATDELSIIITELW